MSTITKCEFSLQPVFGLTTNCTHTKTNG